MFRNFSAEGQSLESACKAYAYRTAVQEQHRELSAALADVERFAVGSEEWKAAIKRNVEVLGR